LMVSIDIAEATRPSGGTVKIWLAAKSSTDTRLGNE
jgi:hypothetical protein